MAEAALSNELLADDEGIPLKTKLARATRRQKIRALALVAPLFLFILISFLVPIGLMLMRSISAPEFGQIMHRTSAILSEWDGKGVPEEAAWKALVEDLTEARANQTIGKAAGAVNYELPAARSLFIKSARKAKNIKEAPYKDALIKIQKRWDDPKIWALMKQLAPPTTARFYVSAVDRKYDEAGNIVMRAEQQQIYIPLFIRTMWMSLVVTLSCLVLAYPVAYLLSVLPLRTSNLLMILVLLPFWTSLLVRTTAWIALLQTQGVINDIAVFSGILSDENRAQLIFNMTGTVIAMTHILLPFMILPLYSVMKTIPPSYMRAARSLGANQFTAFTRVYMPQTLPGVGAGCILVFIVAIGYYITPALVGGESGTLISNMIAYHMQRSLNWGLAAALAALLLAAVLALYWLYNRIVGVDNMKLGEGRKMGLPPYVDTWEKIWYYGFRFFCGLVFLFLILPIIIIIPLSFNVEPYFTFTSGMLSFDPAAYSLRWYADIFQNGMVDSKQPFGLAFLADSWANAQWMHSIKNSFIIAFFATILSATLGTLAALGLSQSHMPARNLMMSLLISPMIVPIIITAAGLFFFFSSIGLTSATSSFHGYLAIILAHAVLGTPFVVITVTATLVGFDQSLIRAGQNMGAAPHTVFFKIVMPLILPGIISGALFAFITSFDEVVAVIFLADYETRTIPRQMWSGIREQISPTILAVATILVLISIALLSTVELLRRRSERLRGVTPA